MVEFRAGVWTIPSSAKAGVPPIACHRGLPSLTNMELRKLKASTFFCRSKFNRGNRRATVCRTIAFVRSPLFSSSGGVLVGHEQAQARAPPDLEVFLKLPRNQRVVEGTPHIVEVKAPRLARQGGSALLFTVVDL